MANSEVAAASGLRSVTLAGAADFEGFRRACRTLWAEQIEPDRVSWHTADDVEGDLFEDAAPGVEGAPANASTAPPAPVNVPASYMPLAASVALHADPLHVAWFEPEHHIVEATAPFFARRFTNMRWAILTPERSVRWDGSELAFGPGGRRDEAPPADAGEALWLTYYRNIFNPARLKLKMMQKEMPKRYWHNLPEAQLIDTLTAQADERSMTMIAHGPSDPVRRLPARPHPIPVQAPAADGNAPASLPALREALERCRECPIGEHATQAVPGEGLKHVPLMFVGEQPGDQEDLQGRPFVGPAGQLLSRALEALAIPRDQVYITNAVKHFKFELRGKRRIHKTPAQQEAAACLHWLESEIALVAPQVLVALGATAARQLMGRAVAVTRERGQWLTRADGRRVLITLHPSALLRMEPEDKAAAYEAWLADLRHAADHYAGAVPGNDVSRNSPTASSRPA